MARSPDAPKTQMDSDSPLAALLAMSARDSSSVSSGNVAAAWTATDDRRCDRAGRRDAVLAASNLTPGAPPARWWLLAMKRRFAGWARRAGGGGATRATRALTAAMALS